MLTKIFFAILIFLTSGCIAFAYTDTEYLNLVEKQLFFTQYKSEKTNKRIDRIEKATFGKTYNISTESRMAKLKTIYKFEEPKSVTPPLKTVQKSSQQVKKTAVSKSIGQITKANNTTKYPQVTEMEQYVLQKSYENENIYNRLDRLEQNVFGYKSNNELADRVEQIKIAIYGNQQKNANSIVVNQNIGATISGLENMALNTTYPNESNESRLSRLEQHYFNSTSEGDDIEDRIDRVSAIVAAEPGTAEYKDIPTMRQYQTAAQTVSIIGVGLMIIQSLLH